MRPTFIRSGNMVAIFLSLNDRQIERVQLALGAGPPQPKPPQELGAVQAR